MRGKYRTPPSRRSRGTAPAVTEIVVVILGVTATASSTFSAVPTVVAFVFRTGEGGAAVGESLRMTAPFRRGMTRPQAALLREHLGQGDDGRYGRRVKAIAIVTMILLVVVVFIVIGLVVIFRKERSCGGWRVTVMGTTVRTGRGRVGRFREGELFLHVGGQQQFRVRCSHDRGGAGGGDWFLGTRGRRGRRRRRDGPMACRIALSGWSALLWRRLRC